MRALTRFWEPKALAGKYPHPRTKQLPAASRQCQLRVCPVTMRRTCFTHKGDAPPSIGTPCSPPPRPRFPPVNMRVRRSSEGSGGLVTNPLPPGAPSSYRRQAGAQIQRTAVDLGMAVEARSLREESPLGFNQLYCVFFSSATAAVTVIWPLDVPSTPVRLSRIAKRS